MGSSCVSTRIIIVISRITVVALVVLIILVVLEFPSFNVLIICLAILDAFFPTWSLTSSSIERNVNGLTARRIRVYSYHGTSLPTHDRPSSFRHVEMVLNVVL